MSSSYAEVRELSFRIASALDRHGVAPGRQGRDPVRQRPGRVHLRLRDQPGRGRVVPDQPAQRGGREPRAARPLRLHRADPPAVVRAAGRADPRRPAQADDRGLPGRSAGGRHACRGRSSSASGPTEPIDRAAVDDLAMIVGTGGTTGRPKGVMLTGTNLETMTAITLMSYPFEGRPVYLALAPLTHAAGVLCFPVHGAGRRDRGDANARRRALPAPRRGAPGDAHLPAADPDLHGARPPGALGRRPLVAAVLLVRRRADVDQSARGGTDPHRTGDGPAVRPDRGADDGLRDPAGRPLPRRTDRSRTSGWPRPGGRRHW